MSKSSLYKAVIIDHYKSPRNARPLLNPMLKSQASNISCGDYIILCINFDQGIITEVGYDETGCAISIASMSILSEKLKGMSLKDAQKINSEYVLNLLGMSKDSPRAKCALLSLEALKLLIQTKK